MGMMHEKHRETPQDAIWHAGARSPRTEEAVRYSGEIPKDSLSVARKAGDCRTIGEVHVEVLGGHGRR
jgi:hypothetical protein